MISRRALALAAIFGISLSTFPAAAQEVNMNPALEKGIGAYKHENYEEAQPLLIQAREEEPGSTLAAYYLGLNYKQLQNYREAIPHLRDAVTKSPKIKGALIELIDCLYQYNELEEAKKWIAEARREGIRPAQIDFLNGLVLIKEEKYEEAIVSFKDAKERDAAMTQASDYQIGLAQLKAQNLDGARESFAQVADIQPSSNLALYANEYIDALERRQETLKPWRLDLMTAWQYDDNVVLKPEDAAVATDIADESDTRTVYNLKIENNRRFDNGWGFKGQYNLYNGIQDELDFYDTMSHSLLLQPSVSSERTLLAFPTSYTHTIVDERSYLSNPSTGVLYNFAVGDSQMGQAFVKAGYKDFLWTPVIDSEDRDGEELGAGLGWYWFFAQREGFFNLRAAYDHDWTDGANWDAQEARIDAAILIPVMEKLNFSLGGGAAFQDYFNTHTVFNEEREDQVYSASTLLAYEFCKYSELQVQYTYINDKSNIDVFEYDRSIYSAGMEFKF